MGKPVQRIDLTADSPPPARAFARPVAHVPPPAAETKPPASKRAAESSRPQPVAAKKAKPSATGCALLWIPYTCQGGVRTKVIGVYATRRDAEEARRELLEHYEGLGRCYGHGDICVGDDEDDEISLVLRPAPLFLK